MIKNLRCVFSIVLPLILMLTITEKAISMDLFFDDFSNITWSNDPTNGNPFADGDMYPGNLPYENWGRISTSSVVDWNTTDAITLLGHNNDSGRSAGKRIQGSDFGSTLDLTLEFGVIDIDNAAGTKLYVEVWEAKEGPTGSAYYLDTVTANGTGPSVGTFGDAYLAELAAGEYDNSDTLNLNDPNNPEIFQLTFSRVDPTADLILMFHGERTGNFYNAIDLSHARIFATAASPVAGDYNGDGSVNAADYTVWRDNDGGDESALAAGSRDPSLAGSPIGSGDYSYWASNYTGSTSSSATAAAVPEPSTIALGLLMIGASASARNRLA